MLYSSRCLTLPMLAADAERAATALGRRGELCIQQLVETGHLRGLLRHLQRNEQRESQRIPCKLRCGEAWPSVRHCVDAACSAGIKPSWRCPGRR